MHTVGLVSNCMSQKQMNRCLIPRIYVKKLGVVAHDYNPSTGKAKAALLACLAT